MAKNDDIIQLLLYLARQKMIPRDDATLAVLLVLVDPLTITETAVYSRTGHPTVWGSGNKWGFITWG